MQGEPVLVAKALSIAICIIAQRRKRKVLVVKYSYSHDLFRLHNIEHDKKDLLDFLGEAEMGGNDEDSMFRWLFDEIMPFEGDYSTADILCISDFGWMPISEEVMDKINAEKQKGMTFYGLNIVDSSTMGQYIRDHMEEMSEYLGSPTNVCPQDQGLYQNAKIFRLSGCTYDSVCPDLSVEKDRMDEGGTTASHGCHGFMVGTRLPATL